jgi:predicted  nucleic acid-binding Zn-ribbon protein
MENNKSSGNNTNKLLLVLLLASIGTNIWLFTSKSGMQEDFRQEKDSLITANVDIEKELNDTYTELNQYKGINSRLDSLLQEANGKIDEQKARIEELIRKEGKTSKLNKQLLAELNELKKLRDQYLEKIDQLLVENEQLKKEKTELSSTVENLSKDLEKTINTASVLRAEYLKANAFKKRSNDKYAPTAMARRTNKIELCFSVLENKIAKSGTKTAYFRLIEPGGKVLGNRAEGSSSFRRTDTNEDVLYTATKTLEYSNEKMDNICMQWEEADRVFTAGNYILELYIDGNPAGTTSIMLR